MENEKVVSGTNEGAKASVQQPKIVAQMPEDKELKDPEEAAKNDHYPGSCQI